MHGATARHQAYVAPRSLATATLHVDNRCSIHDFAPCLSSLLLQLTRDSALVERRVAEDPNNNTEPRWGSLWCRSIDGRIQVFVHVSHETNFAAKAKVLDQLPRRDSHLKLATSGESMTATRANEQQVIKGTWLRQPEWSVIVPA
jgi:hypothetical protein